MTEGRSTPLVSIVMTTYNGERYLAQQMDSLLQQTYPHLEIVVVDDCSTDGTFALLQQYARRHPHISVYRNETNLGYIRNFEKACALSKGDFIALCDQDDAWKADKIEKLAGAIGDFAMIHSDSMLCNQDLQETGRRISDNAELKDIHSPLEQAVFCRIYGHSSLFTRSFFEQARPFLPIIPHDWWLCYVATLCGGIRYYPEPLVLYRQHVNNLYGAVGTRRKKTKEEKAKIRERKRLEVTHIRQRMQAFADRCPDHLPEKKILQALNRSYQSFSLPNNFSRMMLFFRYHPQLLTVKKRSALRKYLFCLKMFFIIK